MIHFIPWPVEAGFLGTFVEMDKDGKAFIEKAPPEDGAEASPVVTGLSQAIDNSSDFHIPARLSCTAEYMYIATQKKI